MLLRYINNSLLPIESRIYQRSQQREVARREASPLGLRVYDPLSKLRKQAPSFYPIPEWGRRSLL